MSGFKFYFGTDEVTVEDKNTYVGVLYSSNESNIFKYHYKRKADKAEKICRMVFALENIMGTIPPSEGIKFYNALIEPHLTHGCEIALDTTVELVGELQKIQTTYLRRLLGLWERSIRCILHTETGLAPIRYRRLDIALSFLQYAANLADDHLVRKALEEVMTLDMRGHRSWITELKMAIMKVNGLHSPAFHTLPTDDLIKNLKQSIRSAMNTELMGEFNTIDKLYLIHDRLEPMGENQPPKEVAVMYRHYWDVRNTKHRRALAGLILSNHGLAVERLRWRNTYIPRDLRKCRLCAHAVETPEHALLECRHQETTDRRIEWLREMNAVSPDILGRLQEVAQGGAVAQLRLLIADRTLTDILAGYAYDILQIYDQYPLVLSTIQ